MYRVPWDSARYGVLDLADRVIDTDKVWVSDTETMQQEEFEEHTEQNGTPEHACVGGMFYFRSHGVFAFVVHEDDTCDTYYAEYPTDDDSVHWSHERGPDTVHKTPGFGVGGVDG